MRGTSVIPKSSHASHIRENLKAKDCQLGVEDLAKLKLIGDKYLTRFSNPGENWGVELFDGLDGI